MLHQLSKVYLIEDDAVTTFLIKTLMEKFSFASEILTYSNGAEALDALQKAIEFPELLFLDLNMPIMDGWQFLETIQNIPKFSKIPTYILTSSVDPSDKSKSVTYPNVVGYLTKPLSKKDLSTIQKPTE
ncbi:Receiver protein of a two-component response regulator [Leptospira biflexa serovar Patoc strain 'Patoc 1 (Ames)']|uniref:Putative response regulator n=1 Tax=Leptospira biflexa serovar Patoc (strain Patoc 1 / ATCC 23582 / Paris) TaxID=456481 RepID=B0STQ1_LEPBP|nr:response regulator [Leptospira biflexa]ABZ95871.1 Receiver protein of a two-component response regulator [Leptospira biflexa serovar Patoc strain 'Patoc 1 (Ames)']ABZ99585.1 Putative response regulator [Leptospira biflexa serovar Patoc strain 'Patoc 1 (Paris)']